MAINVKSSAGAYGSTAGLPASERQSQTRSVREVKKAGARTDTYEGKNRTAASQPAASKGFFEQLFDAIGRFFTSIWALLTGTESGAGLDGRTASGNEKPARMPRANSRSTDPVRSLQPENPASATDNAGRRAGQKPVAGATPGGAQVGRSSAKSSTTSHGLSLISPTGHALGMSHSTQPTGTSCKPTAKRMIEQAGGHVGNERVGNDEATRLDGPTLRRLFAQLQSSGVLTGVRSRTGPKGSIKGAKNGHVLAVSGYTFVDRAGQRVDPLRVREALDAAGGDWDRVLASLDARGITLRLQTLDPGRGTGKLGASSYLDVLPNGLAHRPALAKDRYVSTGYLTVRYFMLD